MVRKTETSAAKPLVLVVEDYDDTRELYVEYLELSGFCVAQAQTGDEAVEKALELRPDIILMDLALPGTDGREATRRLKTHERTRQIPIIAVTGHALPENSAGAERIGCDSIMTKPCAPDALVDEVRKLLDR